MIFGHFTCSYVGFKFFRPNLTHKELSLGIFAAYFPDILDKSLYFAHITQSSRSVGHHFAVPCLLTIGYSYIKWEKIRKMIEIFSLGILFHQFQDCSPLDVWLWPLFGEQEPMLNYTLWESLKQYYSFKRKTLEIYIELIGHFLFFYSLLKNKLAKNGLFLTYGKLTRTK